MKKNRKFKNLFKKLHKTKLGFRITFYITFILYLISICLLSYSILLLAGIETFIRTIIILILFTYLFIYLIFGLTTLITKKHTKLIIVTILTLIFAIGNVLAYYYINKTYQIVDNTSKEKVIYTTKLIALSKDVNIKTIGLIKNENDTEGYTLPQEYIATNNLKYKIVYYEDYYKLLEALYDKKVDAIFIGSNYKIKYRETEKFANIATDTVELAEFSKKLDNQDTVESTNKSVTEPFTVLLLGVDSEYDGLSNNAAFNGDSIMLVTFNPKTLSATMFSIPRDTYVPIACNNNKGHKINSAAAYGTKCMIDTIHNLTDINIDYYVKINFKGVVALVNALGGITMDIDKPDFSKNLRVDCKGKICEQNSNRQFGNNLVFIEPGKNKTLNGEQALAYARNRHQWALSDFKRIEHQQAVVTAIANKAKTIRDVNTFYKVLNAVSNNIDTNMAPKEILNFYNVFKSIVTSENFSANDFINIQKTYLTGYDLTIFQGYNMYTFQYNKESLDEIVKAMKENLEITKPTLIKTFNFSVNEEYKVPVIGKIYTTGQRNETMPNFVGSTIGYLESWVSGREITLTKEYQESTTCMNNQILSQNVHQGTLITKGMNLNVKVCKNNPIVEPTTTTTSSTVEETP